ncbi:MAG: hypothetical protein A4E61_00382 [Syntrophorhabdus sp. PtaB.Bin184]|nr:MAG: hypothetical protein A4E61_00382 [Syntrophorhabdus sp. PtaB.Bin184]
MTVPLGTGWFKDDGEGREQSMRKRSATKATRGCTGPEEEAQGCSPCRFLRVERPCYWLTILRFVGAGTSDAGAPAGPT